MFRVKVNGIDVNPDTKKARLLEVIDTSQRMLMSFGTAQASGAYGTFGVLHNPVNTNQQPMEVGKPMRGPAQILTSIDECGIKSFDVVLEQSFTDCNNQNFVVVKIVDEDWPSELEGTFGKESAGGMSGSPVVQDGKLVAVLSHRKSGRVGALWAADMITEHKKVMSDGVEKGG